MTNLPIPQNKDLTLEPFQVDGVKSLLESPSKGKYLADEMGLGKTVQAIVYANAIDAKNILIVVPASLRLNWLREFNTWSTLENKNPLTILSSKDFTKNKDLLPSNPSPVIISYDLIVSNKKIRNYLYSRAWDIVICDEAHALKSIEAKRTLNTLGLFSHTKHFLAISGTPMTNTALDLFPVLCAYTSNMDYISDELKELCSRFHTYARTFTYVYYSEYGTQYKEAKNVELLNDILRNQGKFFVRRTVKKVLKDLPSISFNRFDLDLDVKIHDKELDKHIKKVLELIEKGDEGALKANSAHYGVLRRELGESKASHKHTYDFIEQIIEHDGCVIVYFYHKTVRDAIQTWAKSKKYSYVVHDGDVSAMKKQEAVDKFQEGKADIFLAQSQAAVGYTVTRATKAVFVEYPWLPSEVDQACKRLHRIGQTLPVNIYFLVSRNAFDIELIKSIIKKQKYINQVIGD